MKEEEHPMRSDMIQLDGKSSIKLVEKQKNGRNSRKLIVKQKKTTEIAE